MLIGKMTMNGGSIEQLNNMMDWKIIYRKDVRWDICDRAMDILYKHFIESKDHKCICPAMNFSWNGIGCKCGGR